MAAMKDRRAEMPRLILASSSPQRRALLASAGYSFTVAPPADAAEDGPAADETPAALVARLARQKAADVAARSGASEAVIVACDTVAECGGEILGKPRDEADARRMLHRLRGQIHRVLSGLCVWPLSGDALPAVRVDVTELSMALLDDAEVERYLATGQWQGKAGAFGLQDSPGWIQIVRGSESNVIGLPLELLADMLHAYSRVP